MAYSLILAVLQAFVLTVIRLPFIAIGFILVAIGIPFRKQALSKSDGRPIWVLPSWLWIWSNDHDGITGDKRGWWDANAPFGLGENHWFSMWVWTALRNPANNLRHVPLFSAPTGELEGGYYGNPTVGRQGNGYCLTWGKRPGGWYRWYGFYLRQPWRPGATRGIFLRFGFKFKPEDLGKEDTNDHGLTFRFSFAIRTDHV